MLGVKQEKYGLTSRVLRQRDKMFMLGRALYKDSADRRHQYDELSQGLGATPNPVLDEPKERLKALYGVHFSDVSVKPAGMPSYVVSPDVKINRVYEKLYFVLHYSGMEYGGMEAVVDASKALGKPVNPLKRTHYIAGVNSIWCTAEGVSPKELVDRVKRVGAITNSEAEVDLREVVIDVVLRGVVGGVGGLENGVAFPNYINWDVLGLDGGAGVWSHQQSVNIGNAMLSSDYDEAFRLIMRHVSTVNYGLHVALTDLEDSSRNRVSSRFYNQIPPKYRWIRTMLDTMANSASPRGWTARGFSQIPLMITNKFPQAAAAAIWNRLAYNRIKLGVAGSLPGDLILLDNGEVTKCATPGEYGIDQVVIPTLGSDSNPGNFPELRRALGDAGVGFVEFNGDHLPKSYLRKVVGIAGDVKVERRKGGLAEYVQTYEGAMLRSNRTWLNVKGVKSRLYGKGWNCIPCGKANPSSATRCWTCGEHINRVSSTPATYNSTSHTHTYHITARLPAEASPVSLLSEVFSLHHLIVPRDDTYLKTVLDSFTGKYFRPALSVKKRKNKVTKKTVKPKATPRPPAHLENYTGTYINYTWPKNPLEDGVLTVVEKPGKEGLNQ
eukprot:TRINITY_DN16539_c0_g1_i1.p1 TRINITY_DN16539_c0_g1~~TRINITY_DN16539_c0_g1_i1.p1  ORF type:complete len:661 (+),score=140.24 TRINITY_DN16539_c0_g1_i1:155-1984(+)